MKAVTNNFRILLQTSPLLPLAFSYLVLANTAGTEQRAWHPLAIFAMRLSSLSSDSFPLLSGLLRLSAVGAYSHRRTPPSRLLRVDQRERASLFVVAFPLANAGVKSDSTPISFLL